MNYILTYQYKVPLVVTCWSCPSAVWLVQAVIKSEHEPSKAQQTFEDIKAQVSEDWQVRNLSGSMVDF